MPYLLPAKLVMLTTFDQIWKYKSDPLSYFYSPFPIYCMNLSIPVRNCVKYSIRQGPRPAVPYDCLRAPESRLYNIEDFKLQREDIVVYMS